MPVEVLFSSVLLFLLVELDIDVDEDNSCSFYVM